MDALTSILFYACAAVSVAGALAVTIAPARFRFPALAAVAAGTAASLALLAAGFAAAMFLVAGLGCAAVLRVPAATVAPPPAHRLLQAGGVGAAALFAALAYAAFRGSFALAAYPGGVVNSAALGRLLLDRDVLAGVALGGLLLVGIAGAAASWRAGRS